MDVTAKMFSGEVVCLYLVYVVYCLVLECFAVFISTMSIGAWLVASDVRRVSGMYVARRLLDMLLTAEAFTSVV